MKTQAEEMQESLGLARPRRTSKYRVLVCKDKDCNPPHGCGDSWEIAILDDGRWCIDCTHCHNTAAMFSDFVGVLK